jgi:RecB family exonuclease
MGTMLHAALNAVYRKQAAYADAATLQKELEQELKKEIKEDILLQFEGDIWLKRLEIFCIREIERFAQGYRVEACEVRMGAVYDGVTLEGVIDRIDVREGKYSVIDYKSGAYADMDKADFEKTKDFQLLFYHILASALGEVEAAFYYDLKTAKTVHEYAIVEKKEFLSMRLKEYRQPHQRFDKTDEVKECHYCLYKIICGRE